MYDTSDIRKGLKIMIDGSPYTVIEFQFVKPGKGAAFTRTKMKNLLTGRGARAQPALGRQARARQRRDEDDAVPLQGRATRSSSWTRRPTTRSSSRRRPSATSADFMPENINVEVLFFNDRAVGVTLPNFIEQPRGRDRARLPRRHRDAAPPSRRRSATGATHQRPAVHQRRRHRQDRHAHGRVPRARRPRLDASGPMRGAPRETLEARARILRAVRAWFEAQGFLEVETPARVRSPGQEVHLDAIAARGEAAAGSSPRPSTT